MHIYFAKTLCAIAAKVYFTHLLQADVTRLQHPCFSFDCSCTSVLSTAGVLNSLLIGVLAYTCTASSV